VPPYAKGLGYNGSALFCICASGFSGPTCLSVGAGRRLEQASAEGASPVDLGAPPEEVGASPAQLGLGERARKLRAIALSVTIGAALLGAGAAFAASRYLRLKRARLAASVGTQPYLQPHSAHPKAGAPPPYAPY